MSSRRHGSKPKLALWMLVAIADVAILAVAAGPLALMLTFIGVLVVVAAIVAVRVWPGRDAPKPEAVARRRA